MYDSFSYRYPPRPESKILPNLLRFFQNRGWIAQAKLNGTCSVIFVPPDRKPFAWNRHNEEHKAWSFTPASAEAFAKIPSKNWYVFVAELLHSKVPGLRDINYIHDCLVKDGVEQQGKTYLERSSYLLDLFKPGPEAEHWHVVNPNTWIAKNHYHEEKDFRKLFDSLDKPELEGLVLKDPQGTLKPCFAPSGNSGWSVKCRKPTKNYGF